MKKHLAVAASLLLMSVLPATAFGYNAIEVKNGGTIKGIVKLKGAIPPEESVAIDRNTEICGSAQELNKYILSDSRMKNVVVFLDNPQQGKPLSEVSVVNLTINKCRVEPLVSIGFVGGKFLFKNTDEILHTLQLKLWLEYQRLASARPLENGATIYNLAFPVKDKQIEKPIKEYHRFQPDTGSIKITSNSDPWIRGYVFVFDHPYAAVTDGEGEFVLSNVPPGEYTLKVWHEGLGMQQRTVKVVSGETVKLEVEIGGEQ